MSYVSRGTSMPAQLAIPQVVLDRHEEIRVSAVSAADAELANLAGESGIPFDVLRDLIRISRLYPADMTPAGV